MERVVFLLEPGGERIGCLLNPESLQVSRQAGASTRPDVGGLLEGKPLADDPVLFTGGGTTEFTFDLLFDVAIAGSSAQTGDVRELTGPLWDLAENHTATQSIPGPTQCYFVWGRAWMVPGIVTAVAERLECFDADGVPGRSWLRMRFQRVAEDYQENSMRGLSAPRLSSDASTLEELMPPDDLVTPSFLHLIEGNDSQAPGDCERLDQLAWRYYGNVLNWRVLAQLNCVDNPLELSTGESLNIYTREELERSF